MRHVGDGNDDDVPSRVLRVGIGFGENRVVVVACIDRIDRQERNAPQIRPPVKLGRLEITRFLDDALGKVVGNAVGMHGDQRHLALVFRIAERFDDLRTRRREPAGAGQFEAYQVAILGVLVVALLHRPRFEFLAVDGLDGPAAASMRPEHAEQPPLVSRQLADGFALEGEARDVGAVEFGDPRHDMIADARQAILVGGDALQRAREYQHARLLAFRMIPHHRLADQIAVAIASGDFKRGDGRKRTLFAQRLPVARERTFLCHLREQPLQRDLVATLDAERARDLAFAGLALRILKKREDLFARRHRIVAGGPRCAALAARLASAVAPRSASGAVVAAASRRPASLAPPIGPARHVSSISLLPRKTVIARGRVIWEGSPEIRSARSRPFACTEPGFKLGCSHLNEIRNAWP